jgi:hypothetical protein
MVYSLLHARIPEPMLEHGGGSRPALPKKAFEEHRKTGHLPAHFVPQNWAFNTQCKMPDLLGLGAPCLFAVSSRLRALLESYATGYIEYITMHIDIAAHMEPADAYFCMNVLRLSRQIDFANTPLGGGTMNEKEVKAANSAPSQRRFVFKHPLLNSPDIWREESFETEGFYYWADPTIVWISDRLHDVIETNFPGQIKAYKQIELK